MLFTPRDVFEKLLYWNGSITLLKNSISNNVTMPFRRRYGLCWYLIYKFAAPWHINGTSIDLLWRPRVQKLPRQYIVQTSARTAMHRGLSTRIRDEFFTKSHTESVVWTCTGGTGRKYSGRGYTNFTGHIQEERSAELNAFLVDAG